VLLLLMAAGCGPTGYTKAGFFAGAYGYSDKSVGADEYAVTVTGNESTSRERVANIALLRAAHLAADQGRTHFVIITKSTQQLERYGVVSLPIPGAFIPVGETQMHEPHAVLIIRLLPNDQAPPAGAIKAADVIAELGPRLE
jgi:hypothetical protein